MGLSLQVLRDKLRKHLGDLDTNDLSNADADLLINQSAWEVFDLFDFRDKAASTTITTISGTNTYTLPVDLEGLQSVSIKDINSLDYMPLKQEEVLEYEENLSDRTDSQGEPDSYLRRGSSIILNPIPNDVWSLRVAYQRTLSDIAANGPTIPQPWHEVILYGAVWRGFLEFGDYNRGEAMKKVQATLINPKETTEQKEKYDYREAGLTVKRRPYR